MKIQKIIQGLAIMLVVLASCTEERIIDGNNENGTFSISFASGDVETKAVGTVESPGYIYTTPAELTIGSCFVGVFEQDGGKSVFAQTFSSNDRQFAGTPQSGKFSISGLTLPIGKALRIVAIANPKADYTTIATYEALQNATHIYSDTEIGHDPNYTFDPSSLVKVGEKSDVTLSASTTEIGTIELRQLAAKIRLQLDIDLPKLESTTSTTGWNFGGVSLQEIIDALSKDANKATSDKVGKLLLVKVVNGAVVANFWDKATWPKDNQVVAEAFQCDKGTAVADDVSPQTSNKFLHLTGANGSMVVMSKITTTPSYLFELKTIQIQNIEMGSNLFISVDDVLGTKELYDGSALSINQSAKKLDFTFYTYAKPYFETEQSDALTVVVKGNVALGSTIKTETFKLKNVALHPIWDYNGGWGDGTNTKFTIPDDDLVIDTEHPETTEEVPGPAKFDSYTYNVVINPIADFSVEGGLLNGYYYDVTGVLKQNAPLELLVNKVPWNRISLNPSYDSSK